MGNWVLVPWKVDVGISDDLRHVLIVFLLGGAPKSHSRAAPEFPMVPNGQPNVS